MKNDLWLFGGILLFLFVLWVYSGGPNHPISFAGPYLTPVTDYGVESEGYGPSANQYLRSGSSGGSGGDVDVIDSARSPYFGDVYLAGGDPGSRSARTEYVRVRSNADDDITITGWRLVSAENGTSVRIPEGRRGNSSRERDIELEPGDEALIYTGTHRNSDDSSYASSLWRAYLEKSRETWDYSDTITLLDANGKVVDQYRY
jgi:hypothetical protein